MNRAGERLLNGLVKENPTLVLMLGMCPTLAVTTSAVNGFGMGATTLAVLALSNLIISLLRNVIPKRVRIPAFIVIIASFVTVVQLLLQAYMDSLNKALGVYIPLIVVNCIILGRAESYAYSNPPIPALFDGIGMGLGFTVALTCIGAVRELLGAGELFGFSVMPDSYEPALIFVLAPGAFFVLAALTALQNLVREKLKKAGRPYEKIGSGCSEDCMNCSDTGCTRRFYDLEAADGQEPEEFVQEEPAEEEMLPEEEVLEEELLPEEEASGEEPLPEEVAEETPLPEKETAEEEPLPEEVAEETPLPEKETAEGEPLPEKETSEEEPLPEKEATEEKPLPEKEASEEASPPNRDNKGGKNDRGNANNKNSRNQFPQDNKAARNGGRTAQYDKAAQGHKTSYHRKASHQRRKK